MKIEVEIRSFISQKRYHELDNFFSQTGIFLGEDIQETMYFSAPIDLRVQKNSKGTKIWAKQGKMHAETRGELECHCLTKDYSTLLTLFGILGFHKKAFWRRKRRIFAWRGVTVALDYTRNYGYIIELEKSVTRNEQQALAKIQGLFNDLNISPTSKEEFDNRYKVYVEMWQSHHQKAKTDAG